MLEKKIEIPYKQTTFYVTVREDGRITHHTFDNVLRPKDIIKANCDNGKGYKTVILSKKVNGVLIQKRIYVHILVAMAFIPGWNKNLQVNHKNMDKSDNSLSNLEAVTEAQNKLHYIENTLTKNKLNFELCLEILNLHDSGLSIKKISLDTGVNRYIIRRVLSGDNKRFKKYYESLGNNRDWKIKFHDKKPWDRALKA